MNNYINPPTLSTSFSESGKSAKKRFDNILNTKTKKTGVFAFVVIVMLMGSIVAMVACKSADNVQEEKYSPIENQMDTPDLYYTMPHYSSIRKALISSDSWGVQSSYPSVTDRQFDEYLSITPNSLEIPVWLFFVSKAEKIPISKMLDVNVYLMSSNQEEIPIEIIDNSITFMPPKDIGEYIYSVVIKFEKGTVGYDIKIVVEDNE